MQKTLLLLFNLLCFTAGLFGQSINNISFIQQGKEIIVNYDISGSFNKKFKVELYVSTDGGNNYSGPLKKVSGDVGDNIINGTNKSISWEVLEEMPDFGGQVVFNVRADIIEEKIKCRFYLGYTATTTAPIGITFGLTGKTGFYLSARLNQGYSTTGEYETDGSSILDYNEDGYYAFTGNDKTRRMSVIVGLSFQLGQKLHFYTGGGYALYNLLWEIDQYSYNDIKTGTAWANHQKETFVSADAEAGLLYEMGHIFIRGGISAPGFKWIEPALSLGILF